MINDVCEDINECSAASYECPADATCLNNVGSYEGPCNSGYKGETCEDIPECAEQSLCDPNAR